MEHYSVFLGIFVSPGASGWRNLFNLLGFLPKRNDLPPLLKTAIPKNSWLIAPKYQDDTKWYVRILKEKNWVGWSNVNSPYTRLPTSSRNGWTDRPTTPCGFKTRLYLCTNKTTWRTDIAFRSCIENFTIWSDLQIVSMNQSCYKFGLKLCLDHKISPSIFKQQFQLEQHKNKKKISWISKYSPFWLLIWREEHR